jgi:hypothetical protein
MERTFKAYFLTFLVFASCGGLTPAFAADVAPVAAAPSLLGWLTGENLTLLLGILLALSEGLAMIPALRANSLFQLIVNVLRSIDTTGDKTRERWAAPGGAAPAATFQPPPNGGTGGGDCDGKPG